MGFVSIYIFKSTLTERAEKVELPQTVQAIRNDLDKTISVPLYQALQVANNTFLVDWLNNGEPAEGIPAWQKYADKVQQTAGVLGVNLESEKTLNYYDGKKGIARKLDPNGNDGWFKRFLDSGKPYEFNLGTEPGKPGVMMFINARVKDSQATRANASIALDVTAMADKIRNVSIGKTGQVFVVDANGGIQIHRNPDLVKVAEKVNLATLPGMAEVAKSLLVKSPFNLAHYNNGKGEIMVASSYLETANWFVIVEVPEAEVYAAVTKSIELTTTIVIVALVVSLVLMVTLLKTITRPLSKLRKAMLDLTSGEGDLTRRLQIESHDEIGEIAQYFNSFMEQLHVMFKRVHEQTMTLNDSVKQLGDMTDNLQRDAQENAGIAEATAATVEEVTVSVAHIADNTRDAAQIVKYAGSLCADSSTSVTSVSNEIQNVAQSIHGLTQVIGDLESGSGKIGSVANVIKEIAEQTNLLALNAAIEAARAGEQGRGFAVVADEVRKLAARTSTATVEIDQLVSYMRQATIQAIASVQHTDGSVKAGVELMNVALRQMEAIQSSMIQVVDKTNEIRDAAEEQTRATEDLASSAENMSRRVQDEEHEIMRTNHVIDALENLSVELNNIVSRFKI